MNLRRLALPAAMAAVAAALGAQPAGAATAEIRDRALLVDGTRKGDRIMLRVRAATPRFLEVAGERFRRSRFDRIDVRARGGRDVVRIDDARVAFTVDTPTTLDGGGDGDRLVGGRGRETLVGRGGRDAVDGNGGADLAFLGAGRDRFTWNPGDGNDAVEGQSGRDELRFNGSAADEAFAVSANGVRASLTRDVGAVTMDLDGIERIAAYAFAGADVLLPGDGPDLVDGDQGDDTAVLGADDDVFRWDPGDGSDVVEGQAGRDELLFNGSGASEIFDVAANGPRVRLRRDVGAIAMDLDGVEQLTANTLGGADDLLVGDMTGTALRGVDADLSGVEGGGSGDGQVDRVSVDGTDGVDAITVAGAGGSVATTGLPASVGITRAEGDRDALRIRTRGGADRVDASGVAPGTIGLSIVD